MAKSRTHGKKRRRSVLLYLGIAVASIILLCCVYIFIDNSRVAVRDESVVIGGLTKSMEGFTILHISDLHGKEFGQNQATLISAIDKHKYDVVAITGNMAGDNVLAAYQLVFALRQANVPVIFITGDSDPAALSSEPGESALSEYVRGMQERGAVYLDAPYKMEVGSTHIWFLPEHQMSLDIDSSRANIERQMDELERKNISGTQEYDIAMRNFTYQLDVLDRLAAARAEFTSSDINISLMRYPLTEDFLSTMQEWSDSESGAFLRRLHLVLAGHYNGGQVRLPFLGVVYIPAEHLPMGGWFPDQKYVSGLMTVSGISQYTSPGLGVSPDYGIPMRIFNTPTVTLIHLTGQV